MKAEIAKLTIECDDKSRKLLELVMDDLLAVCTVTKVDFEGKGTIQVNDNIKISIELGEIKPPQKN